MGNALCKPFSSTAFRSRRIDVIIKKDEAEQKNKLKFLLLGTAEAGKSTIAKQMRILFDGGFNTTEKINAIFQIRQNIIEAFKHICHIILTANAGLLDIEERQVLEIFAFNTAKIEAMPESEELVLLNQLRKFDSVRKFFMNHHVHPEVPDNIYYYYLHLARILVKSYTPTQDDLLHMKSTTTGVHEISFQFTEYTIRMIDVGGQKTERRKWIHFFEGVHAVIFVASTSCFDQYIDEELASFTIQKKETTTTNRVAPNIFVTSPSFKYESLAKQVFQMVNKMEDSIELFGSVQQNPFLQKSSFILFLNKRDILDCKLRHTQISSFFPKYKGNNEFEDVCSFIDDMYTNMASSSETQRYLFTHFTEATSTIDIDLVFDRACQRIIDLNLIDHEVV